MNFPCFTLEGSAWSRGAGAGLAGKREFSKGRPSAFKRSHPPDTLHRHIGTTPPGSAGVSPASSPFACRSVSLRCGSRPSCRREPHGPGRCRAMAPLPVDPGGGEGRGCTRICAGGTPALPGRPTAPMDARAPGGLHPRTSCHQGHDIAEAFGRRLSLKGVHLSSCPFVVLRAPSWITLSENRLLLPLERNAG